MNLYTQTSHQDFQQSQKACLASLRQRHIFSCKTYLAVPIVRLGSFLEDKLPLTTKFEAYKTRHSTAVNGFGHPVPTLGTFNYALLVRTKTNLIVKSMKVFILNKITLLKHQKIKILTNHSFGGLNPPM